MAATLRNTAFELARLILTRAVLSVIDSSVAASRAGCILGNVEGAHAGFHTVKNVQLAELRVAKSADRVEQNAHRLHRAECSDPAGHCTQHAVFGAGVAILSVERIAHEAAITRLIWQVPRKGTDLTLKATYRCAEERN